MQATLRGETVYVPNQPAQYMGKSKWIWTDCKGAFDVVIDGDDILADQKNYAPVNSAFSTDANKTLTKEAIQKTVAAILKIRDGSNVPDSEIEALVDDFGKLSKLLVETKGNKTYEYQLDPKNLSTYEMINMIESVITALMEDEDNLRTSYLEV